MPTDIFKSKPIEELTFTDDGMFQAVLHEEDICAEIIERLLHVKVSHIEYPELEKQIAPCYTFRNICEENPEINLMSFVSDFVHNRPRKNRSVF